MRSRVCPTPPRSCKCWRRVTEQTPAADCGYEEAPARVLAVTQNITLDGSIELLGDWFDPQGQGGVDNSDLLEELHRQDGEADALLLGRQTFEDFRGYWPLQTEDPTGITDYLNSVQKYVVTSALTEPGWQNTTTLAGDPVEAVRSLKDRPGKDIVLTGSITLCHTLIEACGLGNTIRSGDPWAVRQRRSTRG